MGADYGGESVKVRTVTCFPLESSPTPGSDAVAWIKEEIQIKKMYAKMTGIEGET